MGAYAAYVATANATATATATATESRQMVAILQIIGLALVYHVLL